MRHVTDAERRARLAVRHALASEARVGSFERAVRAMTVLHATETPSIYLSTWARTRDVTIADIDRALYDDRTVLKQLAMRRTLFVLPLDLLPAVWSSASARVAAAERTRMAKDVAAAGFTADADAWLDQAQAAVLELLAGSADGLSAGQIRTALPMIDVKVAGSGGEVWSAPRVLTLLGATGQIVRGAADGRFPTARARWTLTRNWLAPLASASTASASTASASTAFASTALLPTPEDGWRELVRCWLRSFGPGTEDDLVWWLGANKSIVRSALKTLQAVAVTLERNQTGWVLADDVDEVPAPEPWTALLPVLDPTIMGWKDRRFLLGPHQAALFDNRGNAGTTAWVDGQVVGCWTQDEHGTVDVQLLQPVPAQAVRALGAQAEQLTSWLHSTRVPTGYHSPAMKQQREQSTAQD